MFSAVWVSDILETLRSLMICTTCVDLRGLGKKKEITPLNV